MKEFGAFRGELTVLFWISSKQSVMGWGFWLGFMGEKTQWEFFNATLGIAEVTCKSHDFFPSIVGGIFVSSIFKTVNLGKMAFSPIILGCKM